MEVSNPLIMLLVFSIPAIIQNYFFQFFSRLRRPIESSILASLSALIVGAALVHCVYNIISPKVIGDFSVEFPSKIFFSNGSDQTELPIIFQETSFYILHVSILGATIGTISARLALWGLPGFNIIGRLYYGGLYNVMSGPLGRDIFVSVSIKDPVDQKTILYQGQLEEIKLGDSGSVDYLTITLPSKSVAEYNKDKHNILSGEPRLVGGPTENITGPRKMLIEGNEISNVFFEPSAPKQTLERYIYDAAVRYYRRLRKLLRKHIDIKFLFVVFTMLMMVSIMFILVIDQP